VGLTLTDTARDLLAHEGYSPVYGARPLKRLIQNKVETPVARLLVEGTVKEGSTVEITADKGILQVACAS
jgi:ATP-dependent Clp protease ATP-binding subunit ClpB